MVSNVYLGLACPMNLRCLPVSSFVGCAPNCSDVFDNDWADHFKTHTVVEISSLRVIQNSNGVNRKYSDTENLCTRLPILKLQKSSFRAVLRLQKVIRRNSPRSVIAQDSSHTWSKKMMTYVFLMS